MAEVKLASVLEVAELAPHTRWLRIQMRTPSALGFRGGQYVIVDSGLTLPNGKAGKRAYSILSSDEDQSCIELATLRIPGGVVSNAVHALEPGAELRFSGPWGKLVAPDAAGTPGSILVLATDTGVTAVLGLLRSSRFAALLANTAFIWLRADAAYFVPEAWVRERLPRRARQRAHRDASADRCARAHRGRARLRPRDARPRLAATRVHHRRRRRQLRVARRAVRARRRDHARRGGVVLQHAEENRPELGRMALRSSAPACRALPCSSL